MFAYVECRDCNYYVAIGFKCTLATGYAHNPTDYCGRKGHYYAIPPCKHCKFASRKDGLYYCDNNGGKRVKPDDFCSKGVYLE